MQPGASIKCYRSPKVVVRSGALQGRGVFAIEPIAQNELVALKAGHIIPAEAVQEVSSQVGDFALQIHEQFFLGPIRGEEVEDLTVFINHSCDPNVGFQGQIAYLAMRDIKAGEELCHDYAMARSDDYQLECRCGSSLCRGLIRGSDWQRKELQLRYQGFFSSYLEQKIRQLG